MDKCIGLVLLISVACLAVPAPPSEGEGEVYYWRDFKGEIPKDALPVGLDKKGNPIYSGQVEIEHEFFSGAIFVGDNKIYYERGAKDLSVNESFKILCTETPEIFEWVPISSYNKLELSDKIRVNGGHEMDFFKYVCIGRKQEKEETHVGKVYCVETWCGAFYTARNWERAVYDDFEILTYNPDFQLILKI